MTGSLIDLEPAVEQHVSCMLRLGLEKHQLAMDLVDKGPLNEPAVLQDILRLLHQVDLLVSDAASYLNSQLLEDSLKALHTRQAALHLALIRAQKRADFNPWPWVMAMWAIAIFL